MYLPERAQQLLVDAYERQLSDVEESLRSAREDYDDYYRKYHSLTNQQYVIEDLNFQIQRQKTLLDKYIAKYGDLQDLEHKETVKKIAEDDHVKSIMTYYKVQAPKDTLYAECFNNKISCIKHIRNEMGVGLKEAKDAFEYHVPYR